METSKDNHTNKSDPIGNLGNTPVHKDIFQMLHHSQFDKDQSHILPSVIYQNDDSCVMPEVKLMDVGEEISLNINHPLHISYPRTEIDSEEHRSITKSVRNSEQCKNTFEQDRSQLHATLPESSHRERKRWVRPPVGESANKELSVIMTGRACLEAECESEEEEECSVNSNVSNQNYHIHESEIQTFSSGNDVDRSEGEEHSGFYRAMRSHIGSYKPSTSFRGVSENQKGMLPAKRHHDLVAGSPPVKEGQTLKHGLVNEPIQECTSNNESSAGVRIPSPSSVSSATSGRRLEWDSGADVGYQMNQHSRAGLSTIERIALARGCSAALLVRLDSEGRSRPVQSLPVNQYSQLVKPTLGAPVAESTPVESCCGEREATRYVIITTESEGEITPILRQQYPEKHIHQCTSSDEYENEVKQRVLKRYKEQNRDKNVSDIDDYVSSEKSFNLLLKKYSTSMSDLSVCENQMENPGRSLPRSFSSLNLSDKERKKKRETSSVLSSNGLLSANQPRTFTAACSVSSSSVATIVQKQESPRTSDKHIQTTHLLAKLSVGIQTSENPSIPEFYKVLNPELSLLAGHSKYRNVQESDMAEQQSQSKEYKSVKTLFQSRKCTGAHKKGCCCVKNKNENMSRNSACKSQPNVDENTESSGSSKTALQEKTSNKGSSQHEEQDFGTLDSIASSTQTAGSWFAAGVQGVHTAGVRRDSAGVVDSANSFEYLPGHVYESNAAAAVSSNAQNPIIEDSGSETDANRIPSRTDKSSPSNEVSDKVWGSSSSSSLARDLEQGVQMFKNLVAGKAYNSKLKKALIRRVIDRLVESDHAQDCSSAPKPSLPLDSNVPWVPAQPNSAPVDPKHLQALESHRNKEQSRNGATTGEGAENCPKTTADRCVGTAPSEITTMTTSSCTPSGSVSLPGDSRAETTTEVSSIAAPTRSDRNWRNVTTQSERDFEVLKRRQKYKRLGGGNSALMDFCQTERQNQLYWIRFEIDHLNNLKQLLERQEGAKTSLVSLASHKHTFHKTEPPAVSVDTAMRALTEKSHQHTSGVSTSSTTNDSSGTPGIIKQHASEFTSIATEQALSGNDNSSHGDITNWASHHYLLSKKDSIHKKEVYTQVPSHSDINWTGKQKAVFTPTPTFDSCGSIVHHADTMDSAMGSILNGSANNGKINVYGQTIKHNPLTDQDKNIEKYEVKKGKAESFSSSSENVPKQHKKSVPICCCECKRILKDIVESNRLGNTRKKILSPVGADTNICYKCRISNVTYKNRKETVNPSPSQNSSSSSSVLSHVIPRTSDDIGDVTTSDSKDTLCGGKMKSIATETTENVAVQTTPSLNKLPIIRPLWFSKNMQPKERNVKHVGKDRYNTEKGADKVCPGCGLVQSCSQEREHVSTTSVESTDDRKRCQCDLQVRRRIEKERYNKNRVAEKVCPCCGLVQSFAREKENLSTTDVRKRCCCDDSAGRKSEKVLLETNIRKQTEKQSSPQESTNKYHAKLHNHCPCCGKLESHADCEKHVESCGKHEENEESRAKHEDIESRAKHEKVKRIKTPESTSSPKRPKEPLAYVLTFEPTTDENIIIKNYKRRSLPEVKVKVPGWNRAFHDTGIKEKEESETIFSSKENEKPQEDDESRGVVVEQENNSTDHRKMVPKLTLKEYLKANRPDYVECADKRRQCMADLAYLREMRHERRQELLALSSDLESLTGGHSRPTTRGSCVSCSNEPTARGRCVMSRRMMHRQTKKIYQRVAEVKNKKADSKRKEDYRTNRLMAEIFTKKLQKKALQGKVNISNSESVISNL